jgi:hypothetical protein
MNQKTSRKVGFCFEIRNAPAGKTDGGKVDRLALGQVRLDLVEVHAQTQSHLSHDFLDFVQGLATEVLELEQICFGFLSQLPDVVDLGILEHVSRSARQFDVLDRHAERFDLVDQATSGRCCGLAIGQATKRSCAFIALRNVESDRCRSLGCQFDQLLDIGVVIIDIEHVDRVLSDANLEFGDVHAISCPWGRLQCVKDARNYPTDLHEYCQSKNTDFLRKAVFFSYSVSISTNEYLKIYTCPSSPTDRQSSAFDFAVSIIRGASHQ